MTRSVTDDNIVWLDMEMTGLDPETCHILEIACFVTDKDLNKISNVFHLVIHQPPNVLKEMGDWCTRNHRKSGLIKESQASTVNIKNAEDSLLNFLKKYTVPGGSPLAGNTIYMDKLFLMKHLPKVANHLHYRLIDVSSINEVCRRWYPNMKPMKKNLLHRAVSDIEESLAELKYFQKNVFPPKVDDELDNDSFTATQYDFILLYIISVILPIIETFLLLLLETFRTTPFQWESQNIPGSTCSDVQVEERLLPRPINVVRRVQ